MNPAHPLPKQPVKVLSLPPSLAEKICRRETDRVNMKTPPGEKGFYLLHAAGWMERTETGAPCGIVASCYIRDAEQHEGRWLWSLSSIYTYKRPWPVNAPHPSEKRAVWSVPSARISADMHKRIEATIVQFGLDRERVKAWMKLWSVKHEFFNAPVEHFTDLSGEQAYDFARNILPRLRDKALAENAGSQNLATKHASSFVPPYLKAASEAHY